MANPHRGEVELKAGEKVYTLVFNTNAMCELEENLKMGIVDILPKMSQLKVIRAVFWAGLLDRHQIATPKEAGKIMDEVGTEVVVQAINEALSRAFPQPEPGAKNG